MINFRDYGRLLVDEPLNKHTTFKIGGKAKYVLFPNSEEDLIKALKLARGENIKYLVLGRASNVLVDDKGFNGLVLILKSLDRLTIKDNKITAACGAGLRELANFALENSLSGLEFAHGIPGSVGGGVIMNAGAYDSEMKNFVKRVRLLDKDLNILDLSNEEMDFGYRHSLAQDKGYIVLSAVFELKRGVDYSGIKEKMDDFFKRRSSKQPLELPSAGSTFRRPEGYFAGKLIDDCGLRGLRHGGAMVSEKHCGFIVNYNKASSKDVKELIEMVQKVVYDRYKVKLVPEVKFIGGDNGDSCNNGNEWSR
ncbi:UDP-N-acetylmuramate dehydrogenase [Peptoniphilus catoniae]|uniref:UDP-N-acetylmuramate dehydrogenase n=1 Tax=Peptoniphilus catoniae TaxID=1660341 RepID=UPI0010FDF353|nr:UDP-N-acetylmuramate dehydrogenase [Peptoniphilus catoniae]